MTAPSLLPQFADGKEPDALRTIGEVAAALDIRQHVLRYWEEQFPMLRPIKRSGGRRYYRPEDVALLVTIDRLVHREGYTLRGARQAIEGKGRPAEPTPVFANTLPAIGAASSENQGAAMLQLRAIRDKLALALSAS